MIKTNLPATFLMFLVLAFTLTGCEAILGIFEAGLWTGIVLVLLVIGIIWYFVSRRGGGRGTR